MDLAPKGLGYADLLTLTHPDSPVPELMDGEIVYKASPRATHAYTQSRVDRALDDAEGGADGWWILIEPDVVFAGDRVLRPDLAGWRKARVPRLESAPMVVVPDWVCEVTSPGHEAHDRVTKRAVYADEGVRWLWLVSPEERTLEAFVLQDRLWMLLGAWTTGSRRIPPFEQLPVDVERLFVPRRPGDPPLASEPQLRYGSAESAQHGKPVE